MHSPTSQPGKGFAAGATPAVLPDAERAAPGRDPLLALGGKLRTARRDIRGGSDAGILEADPAGKTIARRRSGTATRAGEGAARHSGTARRRSRRDGTPWRHGHSSTPQHSEATAHRRATESPGKSRGGPYSRSGTCFATSDRRTEVPMRN